ncbi:50S ribosomal protein L10 [candidate division FCPU426 bacterium]|nr:50S ribosomal protein L10 [candidate division FCPU426 bacterium]
MATNKMKKNQVLEEIRGILKENTNMILTEYRGLNVEKITELRTALRKAGIKFKVLKNTLSKILLKEAGIADLDDYLQGPIAIGFLSSDVANASKVILDYARKNELLVVKAGYIEGKKVEISGLKAIASLPTREVLLGMLLVTMKAPVRDLASVLQGTTRKVLYALNAIKEQKQKQAA